MPSIEIRPATHDRFEDVATLVGPKRPGHRRQGISHVLLAGAVDFAAARGAPAVEGYPVDNQGEKVDLTMAFVGTRPLFEKAGFTLAAPTDSTSGGFPRVVMRRQLRLP